MEGGYALVVFSRLIDLTPCPHYDALITARVARLQLNTKDMATNETRRFTYPTASEPTLCPGKAAADIRTTGESTAGEAAAALSYVMLMYR